MGTFFKVSLHDVNLSGRTVLVRVDYNVPLTKEGKISDDLRIRASLPTLLYLRGQRCKIVLISHLGRPQGRDAKLSLAIVAERVAELLHHPVHFVDDCVGDKVRQAVRSAAPGDVILLENVRFYEEEEADDLTFARSIVKATGADYFVQDGFAVTHRAHASTHAIALCLPGVAGELLIREYEALTKAMTQPKRPLVAIVGGAKIADKIGLIDRLIDQADTILIGGAMANTFLAYRGHAMGASRRETDQDAALKRIYQRAEAKVGVAAVDDFLVLPRDVAVATSMTMGESRREVGIDRVATDESALDIGTQTIERFTEVIRAARTVIWNGPLGLTEQEHFAIGSARVAMAIAQQPDIVSVIGGGDTADFILKWDGQDGANFTHVSTGGGASLELMSGKTLPGIESLLDAHGVR